MHRSRPILCVRLFVEQLEARTVFAAQLVGNTAVYPFSAVAKLESWFDANRNGRQEYGEVFVGTATIIGPDSALTAAHVVYNASLGGFATTVEITPGLNGDYQPFGVIQATNWALLDSYVQKRSSDIALLNLSSSIGVQTGSFGWKVLSTQQLERVRVLNNIGYPSETRPGNQQFLDSGRPSRITSTTIRYRNADIETEPGSSGSAIYRLINGDRRIVGIHVAKVRNGATNIATRITSTLAKFIRRADTLTQFGGIAISLNSLQKHAKAAASPIGTALTSSGASESSLAVLAAALIRDQADPATEITRLDSGGEFSSASAHVAHQGFADPEQTPNPMDPAVVDLVFLAIGTAPCSSPVDDGLAADLFDLPVAPLGEGRVTR